MAAAMEIDPSKPAAKNEGPGDITKLKPGKFSVSPLGRKSDSPVWNYFCEWTPGHAVCLIEHSSGKLCGARITCESGPSNLRTHIKSCCRQLWKDLEKDKEDAKLKPVERTLSESWAAAAKKTAQKSWSADERANANRALALLSVCDKLPLGLGEKRWFQFYSRRISRGQYEPQTHPTVMKHVSQIEALDIQPAIKAELTEATAFAVTMDLWTSRRVDGYLGITAHYINKNWELMELLLSFKKIEGSHTSERVARDIDQALSKLGDDVKSKLSALNADGAKNAQGAIKEFQDTWTLWCVCHLLNLIVRAAFKPVEKELSAVRAVGKATRKSTLAADDLKAAQERMGLRQTQVAVDVVTRWTSLLRSLKSILANRVPLEIVSLMPSVRKHLKQEHKQKSQNAGVLLDKWDDVSDFDADINKLDGNVKESDWLTIELMLPLLEKANDVSKALEASNTVTVSRILPELAGLLSAAEEQIALLSKPILGSADKELARLQALDFAQTFRTQLTSRFDIMQLPEQPSIWWIAAYLDPRYRAFLWLPKHERPAARERVKLWLHYEIAKLPPQFSMLPQPQEPANSLTKKRKAGEAGGPAANRQKLDDAKFEGEDDGDVQMELQLSELDKYHALKAIKGSDPLLYWLSAAKEFPALALIARQILCCPASSAPSERTFSEAELLVSNLRSSLTPDNVSDMMSVGRNQRLLPEYAEMLTTTATSTSSSFSSSAS